jgi:hypothetical protein
MTRHNSPKAFWSAMVMRKQSVFSNKYKFDAILKILQTYKGRK